MEAVSVLLEGNTCPLKKAMQVVRLSSTPCPRCHPMKTFPDTEAKLDPIYAPDLRSGAESTLSRKGAESERCWGSDPVPP